MHTFSLNFQWAEFLARVYEYTVAIVFKAFFVTRNLRKMLYEEGSVIVILYYKREINKFITLIVVGFFCECAAAHLEKTVLEQIIGVQFLSINPWNER